MESILARALEYTLKYWLNSFSRDQFKLQGRTVQLSNLDINGDALHASAGLPPALNVTQAKVGKLEIKVNFQQFWTIMEPGDEQFDFGDEDFEGIEQNGIFQTGQTDGATWVDDDECDDLYNDLNVTFIQAPVTAYRSTKQEHVGNGRGQQKVKDGVEQTTGTISGKGRVVEAFAGSVGYIKHDEINKVEQGAISGNITEFSIESRPKKDHGDDDEVEQQRGGVKKELRFGHPGPSSSTTSFASNDNKAPKNCTLYEDDESYMHPGAQGTNQYDKTQERAKLAVVPEPWQSFPGSRLVTSPLEDRGSQVSAEAVELNMEVPEVFRGHDRNVTASFRESAASGKAGGLNVGGGSIKSAGDNFGASSGKGSTSSPAVSTSNRIGRASSPAASTSKRIGPASIECTGQQNNSYLHSGVRGTKLFVGELHWWTTDADLESALSEYRKVKAIKLSEEKASGKSKGYCQVELRSLCGGQGGELQRNDETFREDGQSSMEPGFCLFKRLDPGFIFGGCDEG